MAGADVGAARGGGLRILAVCTGNVARSAMLGFMLASLSRDRGLGWSVRSAGTHTVEGSTMSSRTRDALVSIEALGEHRFGAHRSHQVTVADVDWSDAVLCAEADHVRFLRSLAPHDASRVVQVRQFVRAAPRGATLADQLAAVAALEPDAALDVEDPAGHEQSTYDEVARDLWGLANDFAAALTTGPGVPSG